MCYLFFVAMGCCFDGGCGCCYCVVVFVVVMQCAVWLWSNYDKFGSSREKMSETNVVTTIIIVFSLSLTFQPGDLDVRILKPELVVEIHRIDVPGDEPFSLVQLPIENGCQLFDWHFGRFRRLEVDVGEEFSRGCR